MLYKSLKHLILIIGLLCLTACQEKKELGTKDNPIKLYFTPSVDADTIATNSDEFIRFLEKETNLYFKSAVPTNYIAVVEAFGSKRADIGVMNSFGYLMANQRYGASAKLRVLRYGHDYYQGQILAHVDSGVKKIEDLMGKKFAYTDPSSISGHMFPKKIIQDHGVTLGNTTFAIKHDNVVTMIYQKQVDAGSTYYSPPSKSGEIRDARSRVKTQFPDVENKIKIITTTEKIPNDPFVFRKDLPNHIITKFIDALKKFLRTESGKKVFERIYSVDGIVEAKDSDWNGLRKMVEGLKEVKLENMVN